ncbi:phosphonate C-P lyase system protein PhnK [Lapidilactobacillus concavus DSM 17758]|uniref:Phosphonate C-P lyase system protein PhnK n=1 Tax=Lapidilactobacillus concavus DSM 17758 TaxID=1423735 RepID=A0A0R1W492_9LACO|nr:ABC transporter ATP-binding protein [Lapidilactobacillus concavus]KRM12471.1 phosphonate C-P lyase system protein PhnK [Lapidilactobacillus concavus DSM 17758]GEL13306.1 multidrug ABC transporter ATP-binding protein [Lapidilactobacillus concavus]
MRLEIDDLTKKIKDQQVLDRLNLKVDAAELLHIVGANGSGKSTLFKLVVNIMAPDSGRIIVDAETHIGGLIENPSFMEDETAKQNMKFLATINRHYDETKIRALFERFGLDYDNKKRIRGYSLGMRQKVGIIQAIMENQNLILLDEPTRGLDQKALETFKTLIHELVGEKKTIIIASHDNLSDLSFDRILRLDKGKLAPL